MANTLLASQVPIPIGPLVAKLRSDCTDSTTSAPIMAAIAPKAAGDFPERMNQLISDIANAYAFGGGVYGIVSGLVITDGGGLLAAISAGSGTAFGNVQYPGGTRALTDNVLNFLWLVQGNSISATVTTTPPYSDCVLIGSVLTASGAIVSIDTTGVFDARMPLAIRYTADIGKPSDSPAANTIFLTRTLFGTWLWDGTGYRMLPTGPTSFNFASDTSTTLTQAVYEGSLIEATDTHPYLTTGRDVIVPAARVSGFDFVNSTAQTLTVKVSGQTGIAVASGKSARLWINGTDVKRLSADI